MCFQSEQTKDAIDRLDSQGKYHPDYDKYPKASWKMKAGEKQHPVIPERTNRGINIFPGIVAGGGPDVVKLGGGAPNPQQYARDKAAARQNTNRTSLSTNDSARG